MKTEKETLIYLLDLANEMRARKGDDQLTDLPESIPSSPGKCIIANAFNYGCEVLPSSKDDFRGVIIFNNQEDLDTYLDIVEIEKADIMHSDIVFSAKLTKELNEIALNFDHGKILTKYVDQDWIENNEDSDSDDIVFSIWRNGLGVS